MRSASKLPWDQRTDLVVIGFGAAGAAAAITAAELGAQVLLLEKQPITWHTPSTRASGGQVAAVSDANRALRYFDKCAGGLVPLEVTRAWTDSAMDVIDWLERVVRIRMIRITGAEHADWDGADAVSVYGAIRAYPSGQRLPVLPVESTRSLKTRSAPPPGGELLFTALRRAVNARERITVQYRHSGQRLVQDKTGRVTGVEVATPQGVRRIGARLGVVLACGGYEYNGDMKRSYLKASPIYFYGSPMNTGDGIKMAQAVGADLWHMNCMIGRAIAHFEFKGLEHNFLVTIGGAGYVLTDKYGCRFADEYMQATARHDFYYELLNYDVAKSEYPRIPCFWFFDQRRMEISAPVARSGAAGPYRYTWSPGSRDEIARGWLNRSDDLAELAEKAGIADPQQAARTIKNYNAGCASGLDSFGRPAESLEPLSIPPFYCMPLWPGGPNTSGGPRRNEWGQIIDVFGDPIPGLYEAGELGEAVGMLYPANGANISDALCFGRIAAQHAVGARIASRRPLAAATGLAH